MIRTKPIKIDSKILQLPVFQLRCYAIVHFPHLSLPFEQFLRLRCDKRPSVYVFGASDVTDLQTFQLVVRISTLIHRNNRKENHRFLDAIQKDKQNIQQASFHIALFENVVRREQQKYL